MQPPTLDHPREPVPRPPTASVPPPPAPAGPPSGPSAPTRSPAGLRQWLVAGVVGGLVGALVASGVFVATDRDPQTAMVVQPDATVSRPSQVISPDAGIAGIIAKVEPAVVAISAGTGSGTTSGGAGTGFVITPDGYIVTNSHVVEGATRISVAFTDGSEKPAQLVGREPSADLAVLKVEGTNLPTVELGDSDAVQPGDEVVAIGNALALDGGLSITRGIVSGLRRTVSTNTGSTLIGMLQTDAAINPGNSGGPLVDAEGRVIAINTAIANPQSANNVGFAIPMANARPIIDDLRLGRPAAFLGVSTVTVTPALAREQNLGATSGALVTRVSPGSAAATAGLREGDVIVTIGGDPVTEASDVQALVRGRRPGNTVEIGVRRGAETTTVRATLTERPTA